MEYFHIYIFIMEIQYLQIKNVHVKNISPDPF